MAGFGDPGAAMDIEWPTLNRLPVNIKLFGTLITWSAVVVMDKARRRLLAMIPAIRGRQAPLDPREGVHFANLAVQN
jgi:hypothetical protein